MFVNVIEHGISLGGLKKITRRQGYGEAVKYGISRDTWLFFVLFKVRRSFGRVLWLEAMSSGLQISGNVIGPVVRAGCYGCCMLQPESVRFAVGSEVVIEQCSLPSGFSTSVALEANYVIMHMAQAATVEGILNEDRYSRRLVAGDLHILPAGAHVESHVFSSCRLLVIVFSKAFLTINSGDCVLRPCVAIRDLHLQNLLSALLEELQHGFPAGKVYLEDLTKTLVRYLAQKYSNLSAGGVYDVPGGLPARRLRIVLDYIHGHLDGDVGLTCLASMVQMSTQHFANLFRKSTGLSPHEYVLQERFENARRLLLETSSPIVEVALQTGFASQSHMTDVFRKKLGMPPSRYRKRFSPANPLRHKS
jgi:AraC family transcriptional regulator